MPSVLVEMFFITNRTEGAGHEPTRPIKTPWSNALFEGIQKYGQSNHHGAKRFNIDSWTLSPFRCACSKTPGRSHDLKALGRATISSAAGAFVRTTPRRRRRLGNRCGIFDRDGSSDPPSVRRDQRRISAAVSAARRPRLRAGRARRLWARRAQSPVGYRSAVSLRLAGLRRLSKLVTERLLYTLWDAGLQVGHAMRSIAECVRLAETRHESRARHCSMRVFSAAITRSFRNSKRRVENRLSKKASADSSAKSSTKPRPPRTATAVRSICWNPRSKKARAGCAISIRRAGSRASKLNAKDLDALALKGIVSASDIAESQRVAGFFAAGAQRAALFHRQTSRPADLRATGKSQRGAGLSKARGRCAASKCSCALIICTPRRSAGSPS